MIQFIDGFFQFKSNRTEPITLKCENAFCFWNCKKWLDHAQKSTHRPKIKNILMTKQTCSPSARRFVVDRNDCTHFSSSINYFAKTLSMNLTAIISQWCKNWMTSHPQLCKNCFLPFFLHPVDLKPQAFKFLSCDKFGNSHSVQTHSTACDESMVDQTRF